MNKEYFELLSSIKREGIHDLINWIKTTDIELAPASSKYHSNFAGGLIKHSLSVYNILKKEIELEKLQIDEDTIKIVALLHDICKLNYYKIDYRNVKDETGKWNKVPYYTIDDTLPYGHGEKSVYIISGFIKLTREEAMAIRWHMGGFDNVVKGGDYSLTKVFKEYPLALLTHLSDIKSTYLYEEEK